MDPFDLRLAEALDQFVGPGVGKVPTKQVAYITDIPARDLSFFRSKDPEGWKPCSSAKLARLIKALPAGFAEMLFDEYGVVDVRKAVAFEDNPFQILVEMGKNSAALSHHLSDGELPPEQIEDIKARLHKQRKLTEGLLNALNSKAELANVKRCDT